MFFFILHFTVSDEQDNNNNKYLNSTDCVPGYILNVLQMLIHLIFIITL